MPCKSSENSVGSSPKAHPGLADQLERASTHDGRTMALDIGMPAIGKVSSSPMYPKMHLRVHGVFTCGRMVRSDDSTISISHQVSTMRAADADPLEEAGLCAGTEAGPRGSVLSTDSGSKERHSEPQDVSGVPPTTKHHLALLRSPQSSI